MYIFQGTYHHPPAFLGPKSKVTSVQFIVRQLYTEKLMNYTKKHISDDYSIIFWDTGFTKLHF